MAPAIRPACNCSAPSSVEMDCAVAWVNVRGSAPYLSWLASWVALTWVKLPVMVCLLPLMARVDRRGGDDTPVEREGDPVADVRGRVLRPGAPGRG